LQKANIMLNFFKKLFQMLFGGGDKPSVEETTTQNQESPAPIQADPVEEEKPEISPEPQGFHLELKRESYGKQDTVGKLYLNGVFTAYTIESPKPTCIPEGSYPISLRKAGGKHSSYWFRFKEMHKGMIYVKGAKEELYPCLSIGNVGKEAKGSILVGTELKGETTAEEAREIWYSTEAYKSLYPKIANELEKGEDLQIKISS